MLRADGEIRMLTQLVHKHFSHNGGTKDYDLFAWGANGRYVLVCRWGKVETTGQHKAYFAISRIGMDKWFLQEERKRKSRGYYLHSSFEYRHNDTIGSITQARLISIFRKDKELQKSFFDAWSEVWNEVKIENVVMSDTKTVSIEQRYAEFPELGSW